MPKEKTFKDLVTEEAKSKLTYNDSDLEELLIKARKDPTKPFTKDEADLVTKKLEENKYLCYAYSNNKIYEYLKKTGTNLSLINSVYFAQD